MMPPPARTALIDIALVPGTFLRVQATATPSAAATMAAVALAMPLAHSTRFWAVFQARCRLAASPCASQDQLARAGAAARAQQQAAPARRPARTGAAPLRWRTPSSAGGRGTPAARAARPCPGCRVVRSPPRMSSSSRRQSCGVVEGAHGLGGSFQWRENRSRSLHRLVVTSKRVSGSASPARILASAASGSRLAGQQHLRAPFVHVADKAVARAGRHHDFDAVQRVRAVVLEVVRQLLLAELDAQGLGQRAGRAGSRRPASRGSGRRGRTPASSGLWWRWRFSWG